MKTDNLQVLIIPNEKVSPCKNHNSCFCSLRFYVYVSLSISSVTPLLPKSAPPTFDHFKGTTSVDLSKSVRSLPTLHRCRRFIFADVASFQTLDRLGYIRSKRRKREKERKRERERETKRRKS